MEFPDLGEHCSMKECNRLDFLPIKCTGCEKFFCTEHYAFDKHQCSEGNIERNVLPVCPLCNRSIPKKFDQSPDDVVNEHIEMNCEIKKNEKLFKNRCSIDGCKKREVMPLKCELCNKNHCLNHRHPIDHNCDQINNKKSNNNKNETTGSAKSSSIVSKNIMESSSEKLRDASRNFLDSVRTNLSKFRDNFVNYGCDARIASAARNEIDNQSSRINPNPNNNHRHQEREHRRLNQERNNQKVKQLQGDLSEDDALMIVLQKSLDDAKILKEKDDNDKKDASQ